MSHLYGAVSLVPHPVTTFTFRVSGLTKGTFTSTQPDESKISSPSFAAAGHSLRVLLSPSDDEKEEDTVAFIALELLSTAETEVQFSLTVADEHLTVIKKFSTYLEEDNDDDDGYVPVKQWGLEIPHSKMLSEAETFFPHGAMHIQATIQLLGTKVTSEATWAQVRLRA